MQRLIPMGALAAACLLAGCSSAPKVPQASEATKRPANDPAYVEMLRARVELERARQELELQRRTAAAQRMLDEPVMVKTGSGIPVRDMSAARRGTNLVYTVRFRTGGTRVELTPAAREVMSAAVVQAPLVWVRGRTDAAQANPTDERIARERAESMRVLLVQLGVPTQRIRTSWQAAGDAVAPLDTAEGKAANRRVEVEVYAAEPQPGSLDDPRATVAQQ
ncbi:OmpA family protein [Azohydromonas australica]|uniref:OmpA family protein n=1 Tax=Azohydromonas australica TaxID=364039 RepID=UPI00040C4211|nr:OmpA family protein [Azohydromonas australica]